MAKRQIGTCAFDKGDKCSALTAKNCEGCGFFKTEAHLAAGRKRADKRIKALPKERQRRIYDHYYSK